MVSAAQTGAAEATAALLTQAGPQRFRVSLWRQRGGERIRILAVCAPFPPAVEPGDTSAGGPPTGVLLRLAQSLRMPVRAVLASAARLGLEPAVRADLVAAGWRLARVGDDLLRAIAAPEAPAPVLAEIDPCRLWRRLHRLMAPELAAVGVEIAPSPAIGPGGDRGLLADDSVVWSALETMLREAGTWAGRGGRVRLRAEGQPDGGLALAIEAERRGSEAEEPRGTRGDQRAEIAAGGLTLAQCAAPLAEIGLALDPGAEPSGPTRAYRLLAPAARCIEAG